MRRSVERGSRQARSPNGRFSPTAVEAARPERRRSGRCLPVARRSLSRWPRSPRRWSAAPARRGAAGTVRLGMVTDTGGLGDRSFNDSAYAGLMTREARPARRDHGAAVALGGGLSAQPDRAREQRVRRDLRHRVSDGEGRHRGRRALRQAPLLDHRRGGRRAQRHLGDVQRGRRLVSGRRAGRDGEQDQDDRVSRRASTSRCCASSRPASPPARARSTRRSRCW